MTAARDRSVATLAQLPEFDEVIDARSPAEYAEDHIPGARSHPVLDDDQRARVGTLYKQVSPFVAKRLGAALVARNVADHIEHCFQDRERDWRPLVYCWRGGQRSGAFVHILRQIGWEAARLEGGYKAYRRHVVQCLQELPGSLSFRVVSGATGSGKSRLLAALREAGAQVLDLEQEARHRGSLLGHLPGEPQPPQKLFESRLLAILSGLDPQRPVFVEAESRRIGAIQVPGALIEAMRASPCVRLQAPPEARVDFLLDDYAWFVQDPVALEAALLRLKPMHGAERVEAWLALTRGGHWRALVTALLGEHYDPLYERSQTKNYGGYAEALTFAAHSLSPPALAEIAAQIIAAVG